VDLFQILGTVLTLSWPPQIWRYLPEYFIEIRTIELENVQIRH